jgi:thioredoxin-dependent peroxiredoxin
VATFILGLLLVLVGLVLVGYFIRPKKAVPLQVGMQAPDFTLLDETGVSRSLHDFKGKKVVLYFFPKSDTPGCTQQACGIRDIYSTYKEHAIEVLGISYDTPEELKGFKEKFHVPFTFLSDRTKEVAQQYGAYRSVVNALFPARITFLINEQGTIIKIMENVNVATHAEDILKDFKV